MKLANVPTCPFPTYRVSPAPRPERSAREQGSRHEVHKRRQRGRTEEELGMWKATVGGGPRESATGSALAEVFF